MTTDTTSTPTTPLMLRRSAAAAVLVRTAVVACVGGLAAAGVGALVEGRSAAAGVAVGTALTVAVLAWGVVSVNVVAGLVPGLSLVFALLTYMLQLAVLGAALVVLTGSGLLDGSLDREWVGGGVIGVTLLWMVAQVVAYTRARIPYLDVDLDASRTTARTTVEPPSPALASTAPEAAER